MPPSQSLASFDLQPDYNLYRERSAEGREPLLVVPPGDYAASSAYYQLRLRWGGNTQMTFLPQCHCLCNSREPGQSYPILSHL